MTSLEPQPAAPPTRPRFQFTLQTLLLLFVVAASSLGVFGAGGIVVFMLVVGLAVYLREAESLPALGTFLAYSLLALLCLGCLTALLLPAVQSARESGRRPACANNIRQIALAVIAYQDANGTFPPAYEVDKNGKPMHSWRTRILPYTDHASLYSVYDFTKPWDAPANNAALNTSVPCYECPDEASKVSLPGRTNYFAIVGPNASWSGDKPRKFADFGKDASRTILLVEVGDSDIAWTEPVDFSLDALGVISKSRTLPLTSNHHPPDEFFFTYDRFPGVHVVMADASTCFLRTDNLSPDELRKALQIGGLTEEVIEKQTGLDAGKRLNWPNIAALAVWLVSVGTLLTAAVRGRKARFAPLPVDEATAPRV
jgi:hypothetical protein